MTPSTITDSSGQRWYVTTGGYLRPMDTFTYQWHYMPYEPVVLRKPLLDPMDIIGRLV